MNYKEDGSDDIDDLILLKLELNDYNKKKDKNKLELNDYNKKKDKTDSSMSRSNHRHKHKMSKRYFEDVKEEFDHVYCERCHNRGHYEFMCLKNIHQDESETCIFCGSTNHQTNCKAIFCSFCGRKGHLRNRCHRTSIKHKDEGSDRLLYCIYCRSHRHCSKDCCYTPMVNKTSRGNQNRYEHISCFNCGYSGHYSFQCKHPNLDQILFLAIKNRGDQERWQRHQPQFKFRQR